jgi:putative tryptophan/tyrosine transport system substrate-binding protein
MRRRDFIQGLTVVSATWPLAARAQQREVLRKVAMVLPFGPDDPEGRRRLDAVRDGLRQLGWSEDRNLSLEVRWVGNDHGPGAQDSAEELAGHKPEVIFAGTTVALRAVTRATASIPIVFAAVADPVGSGFIQSLARPGGNVTGFSYLEPTMVEKWLELLKEIAPETRRVLFVYDPQASVFGGPSFLHALEAGSRTLGLTPINASVHGIADVEKALAAAADTSGTGLLVMSDAFLFPHRKEITALAARYRLPAVYYFREWVASGGLVSYGPDVIDTYRRAPAYIDRVLRGTRPSDLPVQEPTTFELVVNRNAAKDLHLDIPQSILARADEVIE